MDLGLADSVAIVTGGASGIGQAIARQFSLEGAHISIWDVSDSASATARKIEAETGQSTIARKVDITDLNQLEDALNETVSELGPPMHLIHAAAIGSGKFGFPFTNLTPGDWRQVVEVNVLGMTNMAHVVSPGMMERKAGTMTFIASVAGQIGSPTDPPYSASKAANINFAQCMARDLAPYGVRVNVVCPGMVQTPLNRSVWQAWADQQPESQRLDYDAWAEEKIRKVVPLGTWQEPSDIADMVTFLASKRARQVTGQTINVDGGFVMHW